MLRKIDVKLVASLALMLLALAYIGTKVMLPWTSAVDFRFFWLAGDLWSRGITPYGPNFLIHGREVFESGLVPAQWAYPPHFRVVSTTLALAPLEPAAYLWRAFGVVAIGSGTLLLIAAIRDWRDLPSYGVMIALAAALTMSASAISIAIGQSSPLIFFGYALFVFAYLKNHRLALIVALIIVMIKPTYGLIPGFFLLAQLRYFMPLATAACITLLLSAWGLWGVDLQMVTGHILEAFASYEEARVNGAAEMTGLRHLVFAAGFGDGSQLIYVLIGSALAFVLGITLHGKAVEDPARVRGVVIMGLLLLVFAPFHTYDGYFALAVVIPALALTKVEIYAGLLLFLATWRSNNLAAVTGLKLPESIYSVGSTIESLAAAVVFVVFIACLVRKDRKTGT